MFHEVPKRTDPVAVFVDGDNLSHRHAEAILDEAETHGIATLRRVYGDMSAHKDWDADPRFASHHARSDSGKNNTDIRLVIDAMEHALAGLARVFVIASNDSDFGPLAVRLRELGHMVVGIGGSRPALTFEAGCTKFTRVEQAIAPVPKPARPKLDRLDHQLRAMIAEHGKEGKILLSLLGSRLGKQEKASVHGAATWRKVLTARADRFVLDGPGTETTVRLHHALQSDP